MKCLNCGYDYGEEYAFCPNCGAEYSVLGTYMDLCPPDYYKITSPKYKIAENIYNKNEKLKKEVSYEISKANKIKRCLVTGTFLFLV